MLKIENCRERQRRLLSVLAQQELDLAVITNPKTVYYFSGVLVEPSLPHAFLIDASGKTLLVTHAAIGQAAAAPSPIAADDAELYTWHCIERDVSATSWHAERAGLVVDAARKMLPSGGHVGLEFEFVTYGVGEGLREIGGGSAKNLTPAIDQLRRQKDPDEIECMRRTVELVEAGLAAVKAKLEAGMTEFQAYSIYYEGMVANAETSVVLNGDFACGTRAIRGGGPPTNRRVLPGDLYIFDTFPIYQGYMCDFTRTFSVGPPSQLQQDAWAHVMAAHAIAHRTIRPGVPAKEVYHALKTHLDKFTPAAGSFWHHAGHGVGMSGWEFPWLTPGSEDVVQDREVLACEPGLYAEAMQGGIRLEHNYLVTPEGVTTLDHFPMDLT